MFSSLFSKSEKVDIPWNQLTDVNELIQIDEISKEKPVLIFKHSTRCSISAMSLSRFERSFESEAAFTPYFVDLIANREVSNKIAEKYGIRHESPQTILIKDGKSVFHSSHMGISYDELNSEAKKI
ncbi:bacillithiol system redox-active protein YtxJ [Ekhidna sp.]|uniref:bacillithiol system redox-active protein YtxJ n=1 Tax=Ekhidna sp. TaxID=2608089 RepID=UPI003BAB05B5